MPTITANGKTIEAEATTRLVQAIEDAGIDVGHRCGGWGKCTTCRVEFTDGEPDTMTQAEYDKLKEQDNLGKFRLSCQIVCSTDMSVTATMLCSDMGWDDPGPAVQAEVTPEAVFIAKDDLG